MGKIVALHAIDQPLVSRLEKIIFQLELVMSIPPEKVFNDPADLELFNRITKKG